MPSIQTRDRQFGIEFGCLLEGLQRFFKKLLVHVGGAEIVEACGFCGIRWLAASAAAVANRPKMRPGRCRLEWLTIRGSHLIKDLITESTR